MIFIPLSSHANFIQGLRKLFDDRDAMAMDVGFPGHYDELLEKMELERASFSVRSTEEESKQVDAYEAEVLAGPFTALSGQVLRVRSLSIQEAGCRSFLGGSDCSSRTYFDKAFDPNFIYFTMTDEEHRSSGHVTLVLGEARDERGNTKQVAFVDKIQNVPNQRLIPFLKAVAASILEEGYEMGIPEDVGDNNGISNMVNTRDFVEEKILPRLTEKLTNFYPHRHNYNFENQYSRAYGRLRVKIFRWDEDVPGYEIRKGRTYETRLAPNSLTKKSLFEELASLRDSANEEDVKKYIASGPIVAELGDLGVISRHEFAQDLEKITNDKKRSFQVRKQAMLENYLVHHSFNSLIDIDTDTKFVEPEKVAIVSEVKQWCKSSNRRKKAFCESLKENWVKAARSGNVEFMKTVSRRYVDVNDQDANGYSAVIIAAQNNNLEALNFLLGNKRVKARQPDNKGFTALDHAYVLGHKKIVARLKAEFPNWNLKSEKALQTLFAPMKFIKVPEGEFTWGQDNRIKTKVSSFEVMDVPMTQLMWASIAQANPANSDKGPSRVLINLNGKLIEAQPDFPIEAIKHKEVSTMLEWLNARSDLDDPWIYKLIPGHVRGAHYELITDAQFQQLSNEARTEDGRTLKDLIDQKEYEKLHEYAWIEDRDGDDTKQVATRKPLFINGQPIWDLVGNVFIWTRDAWSNSPAGGVDSYVATTPSTTNFTLRGAASNSHPNTVLNRVSEDANAYADVGVRLIRILPEGGKLKRSERPKPPL